MSRVRDQPPRATQPDHPAVQSALIARGARNASPERKALGAFDTPEALARVVVDRALRPLLADRVARRGHQPFARWRLRIIDPAMGAGAMLVQALRVLRAHAPTDRAARALARRGLHGLDVDPGAVELAREAITHELSATGAAPCDLPQLIARDALICADLNGRFDVVVGNPPFVTSALHDLRGGRADISRRFALARGNWDLCVPFVELSLRLLKPGGVLSLVLPRRLLSARYAAPLRGALCEHRIERLIDVPGEGAFDGARVGVFVLVLRREAAANDDRITIERLNPDHSSAYEWRVSHADARALAEISLAPLMDASPNTAEHAISLSTILRRAPLRLRDLATFRDGATTARAYALAEHVRERSVLDNDAVKLGQLGNVRQHGTDTIDAGPVLLRLVNTGLIDPFVLRWGERPLRYLGRSFARPVVAHDDAERIVPHAARASRDWTVLVAGMGARLEAVAAPPGTLCGKSAVLIVPNAGVCPFALAALLNSAPVNDLYRALFGARGFGARSMTIGPRQIEQLPAPESDSLCEGSTLSVLGRTLTDLHAPPRHATPDQHQTSELAEHISRAEREIDRAVGALLGLHST